MNTSTALTRSLAEPSVQAVPVAAAMPEVLYIMGTGRSGTTILEILLANNPGVVGAGELKHIFRDAFIANAPCACGRSGRQCERWSRVLDASGWTREDCAAMADALRTSESHGMFPLAAAGVASSRAAALYRRTNQMLFTHIAAAAHSAVVVDSSKYAGRALLLARSFPGKVKVLCITRSAAGLIAAFGKKNDAEQRPKGVFAAAAYYLYVLTCMRLVKARLGRDCFAIRFEDLNRDPAAVLRAIEGWSGYSLATSRELIAAGSPLEVGHIVTGNRLRKQGRVTFAPKPSAERPLTAVARAVAAMLERYRRLLGF